MPSSITLTVSHLPTSTSFFLSALQPLNYAYRGRSGETIGFGPTYPPNTPPDFWITQEIPGVPAGAAHVAFPAPSRVAVQDFFLAALKAGGKIHGEPCVRDQSGYYSAAVIDFDGNSIEAVHRPGFGDEDKENDVRSVVSKKSLSKAPSVASRAPSARSVAPSQAPTTTSQRTQQQPQQLRGDVLDDILNEARSAATVARGLVNQARPNLNSSPSAPAQTQTPNNGSGDAIMGTLLGVAAGAALHYAFTNHRNSNDEHAAEHHPRRPSVTGRSATDPQYYDYAHNYRAIEPAPSSYSHSNGRYITMQDNDYNSTIRPTNRRRSSLDSGFVSGQGSTASKASRREGPRLIEAPPTSYRTPTVLTSADSRASKKSRSSSASRSPTKSHSSSRRSSSHTRRMDDDQKSAQTVYHVTEEVRRVTTHPSASSSRQSSKSRATARPEDHPLPPSRASTWAGGSEANTFVSAKSSKSPPKGVLGKLKAERGSDVTKSVVGKVKDTQKLDLPKGELAPSDSVSQVSSSRGSSRRSRR